MNIGLIAMSGVRIRTQELAQLGVTLPGFIRRGKVIASLPSLGLLTVAGLTPLHHNVTYVEIDEIHEFTSLPEFDLVGISSLTARINKAYSIADYYRQKKIPVVMGGLHVSVMPEEALLHADAVVINGAEGAWQALLKDAQHGKLQRIYYGLQDKVFSPENYACPRYELLNNRPYNRITVQTSRGCPRACSFCAASLLITKSFNQKPVEQVISEIRMARKCSNQAFFEFADDNTFLNKKWSKDFLESLIPEEIQYFTETDMSVAEDTELCDLLAKSGCRQLLIGFESPNSEHLGGIDPADWKKRQIPNMKRAIDVLQSRGIAVIGCFILGLDTHTPDVFSEVLEFVRSSGLADVQYTVLTPFPGAPLYNQLRNEGRLLSEKFWDRCTLFDVNYRPKNMTVAQLEEGMRWLFSNTYQTKETSSRMRNFVRQKNRGEISKNDKER